jgi:hypothetical protein
MAIVDVWNKGTFLPEGVRRKGCLLGIEWPAGADIVVSLCEMGG